jgi:serine/threonine protein phosphatase PrpC
VVGGDPSELDEASAAACAHCGERLLPGASFCEACGTRVGGAAPAGAPAPARAAPGGHGSTDSTPTAPTNAPGAADPSAPCVKCGGEVATDGYCTMCGHRALEPITVDDRGDLAAATHRGRRHDRNEDAAALAVTAEGWPVLIVSDGVSASPNPHKASVAAVRAVLARLDGTPFGGLDALSGAVTDAQAAACAVPADGDPNWPADGTSPACTLVIAVGAPGAVHVANVGDARAHLLTPGGRPTAGDPDVSTLEAPVPGGPADPTSSPVGAVAGTGDGTTTAAPAGGPALWQATQLTVDDSVAAQAVAGGVDPELALSLEGGHAITAWLGADATSVEPHLATIPAGPDDLLLACSDGLWNYAPTDAALGGLVSEDLPAPGRPLPSLAGLCQRWTAWAVDRGGADNVTVALAPVPAAGPDQ